MALMVGEIHLEDIFGIQVWEIIRNKNTKKVNRISPHSGDVFTTVWKGLFALASCIPEGRSKDRERGGKEREKEEKDYPCAYIYLIYIYMIYKHFQRWYPISIIYQYLSGKLRHGPVDGMLSS